MILTFEQVQQIVLQNPNKATLQKAREMATKLRMHVDGEGLLSAIKQDDYFENKDVYEAKKRYVISNRDLFNRLLQQESMVFSARGGSSSFGLSESDERRMNEFLANVAYGLPLRKWMQNFALPAWRSDPMGIVLMEVTPQNVGADGQMQEPKAYPTYYSSLVIYDYDTNGRQLEYVVFQLTAARARKFGVTDPEVQKMKADQQTEYFRVIDDAKDLIVKREQGTVRLVETPNISQQNPLANKWSIVPGFILSNIIEYKNPKCFLSPLEPVVELADTFLNDRSTRELQKKFHGFAKAVEPLLMCPTCVGTGYLGLYAKGSRQRLRV